MRIGDIALVYIIDDDRDVRVSLEAILSRQGYKVQTFASADQFLANCEMETASCVLADVRMPGIDGLQLQELITERSIPASTVMITGYADVPLAVQAIKVGAIDILQKPFSSSHILSVIPLALEDAKRKLKFFREQRRARELLGLLTRREQDVAELVVQGYASKEIAEKLRLSPRTVEYHRARLMSRLQISTVPALIKIISAAQPRQFASKPRPSLRSLPDLEE